MRIAIDGSAVVIGGGVAWLSGLIPELWEVCPGDEFWVFARSDVLSSGPVSSVNCRVIPMNFGPGTSLVARIAWQQVVLPRLLHRLHVDILVAPTDVSPLSARCRLLLGIQNANPYWGPPANTWRGRCRDVLLRYLTRLSARRAHRIFFVSEWSRQMISARLKLPLGKSRVIYHGVSECFRKVGQERARTENDWADGHVLVVASVRSHRDFPTLFRAWRRVLNHIEQRRLLIVGPILERSYYRSLTALLHELRIADVVTFLSTVPNEGMPELYRRAACLVLPSYVETFGLPLVEAMACRVPVITSDIPVAREICGEAACYYRLEDADDLANQLLHVLSVHEVRRTLVDRGSERVQRFTWRAAAAEMRDLLQEVHLATRDGIADQRR